MSIADSKLDAMLRDARVPDGLLDRLMSIPVAGDDPADVVSPCVASSDDGLDRRLRDVGLPQGLIERLLAIPLAEDEDLDEALRNIPVPDRLLTACRRHARRARFLGRGALDRALQISRFVMAASLFLALSLSLGGAMFLSLVLNGTNDLLSLPQFAVTETPAPATVEAPLEMSWRAMADDGSGLPESDAPQDGFRREIGIAAIEGPAESAGLRQLAAAMLPDDADPLAAAIGVLGAHSTWDNDDSAELAIHVTSPAPRGLDWPLEKAANRPFLGTTGFHPFVRPAAGSRVQTCAVPLSVHPASYELARRYLERNELPPADRVRTEEFLTAVDYGFARPTRQSLAVHVAGGPSPISGEGFCLLQVGVQARQDDPIRHAPLHLVLLVDTSTSMRWGSRMEIVRRALRELPAILQPEDRLSLVTFNQGAHVLLENLNRDALVQYAAAVDSLTAEGSTNIAGGLAEAYGAARQTLGAGRPAVKVVLLSDGLLDLDPALIAKVERQVGQAAEQNIPLNVIDLGQQKETDPQAAALSRTGRGGLHRAASVEQVRWAFREIISGRSQVVAHAARLQVAFNPKSVIEYRIVGHEAEWGSLLPGPLEVDLLEGQSATALFEVRLAPDGPKDLAQVELTWYAPDGDKTLAGKTPQRIRTTVERKHFAASLAGSAPSLQAAAVVAYTAEVLRHSPFIFQRHAGMNLPGALNRARELAGQVDSRLMRTPSFVEFVDLIGKELKARPARRHATE